MTPSLAMPALMAVLMAIGLAACSEEPQQTPASETATTSRPASAPQAAKGSAPVAEARQPGKGAARGAGGGCNAGRDEKPTLQLMRGQEVVWEKPAEEITSLPGAITIEFGRHEGDPGLPLSAFLTEDGGRMVEVVPCRGEPVRLMAGEFADQPNRYVIVRTPRGMLKLMDFSNPNSGGQTLAKNIQAIRLRALGHEGPRQQAGAADPEL